MNALPFYPRSPRPPLPPVAINSTSTGGFITIKERTFQHDLSEIHALKKVVTLMQQLTHKNIVCYYGTEILFEGRLSCA